MINDVQNKKNIIYLNEKVQKIKSRNSIFIGIQSVGAEREGQRVPCDRAGNCWPKVQIFDDYRLTGISVVNCHGIVLIH